MGLRTHPCGVPLFVMMLAEVLIPILTVWGLPVRKSRSQSQIVVLSIVLYADRRVLQSGCSFKHIPVCPNKTVPQDAFSVRGPEFDLFSHRVYLFQSLSVCRIQDQRDVV